MLRDVLFVIFTTGCIWLVLKGLSKYHIPIRSFLIIVGVWIVALIALSTSGFLGDFSNFPPRMMLVLIIPLVTALWFVFSKRSNEVIDKLPADWMVKMQSFRIVVELFIWWAFLDESLPVQMTFEGRNFDILVGLTAPLAAYLWLKQGKEKPGVMIIWNILGLALLMNIVVVAILSMPTPARVFMNEPANTLVASFPWVLLPGILVVMAYTLHFLSLKQLIRAKRPGNQT